MSRFSNVEGSTLVNNFTLYHADKLSSGRPFTSTCVPQGIWVELFDIEVIHAVEWQHGGYKEEIKDGPDFKIQSQLIARGTFKDTITVFRMQGGEVAAFEEIDVQIKPIKKGSVGGERKASTLDGIGYSGMSSTNVPEAGLMTGDPGTLLYIDPTKDDWPSDKKKPYLQLEGYIDEAEFAGLIQRISMTSAPIKKATLRLVAELFQHEVEVALSEPWYSQDYGMLLRGEDKTYGVTRARVESVQLNFRPAMIAPEPEYYDDLVEEQKTIDIDNLPPDIIAKISKDALVSMDKRIKSILTVIAFGMTFIVGLMLLR